MRTARSLAVCQGGLPAVGVSLPGGVLPAGGLPARGVSLAETPLWTEFLTHAYENITLPQTTFAGGN